MPHFAPPLSPETVDYLTDVVLDELAPRTDRLFAFDCVLRGRSPRHLARIANESRDGFFRRVAAFESVRFEAVAAMRALEGTPAPLVFE